MKKVFCLDDGTVYFFNTDDAEVAMYRMKRKLDKKNEDENATINKTESGRVIWMEHGGKKYSVSV